jgi:hypothetical protein
MAEADKDKFIYQKALPKSGSGGAESKQALLELIRQIPDEHFARANNLFSSFRGAQNNLIM